VKEIRGITGKVEVQNALSGIVGAKTINIGGKPYEGEYEVTPKFNLQKLNTKGAILQGDIVVNQISVNKSANDAGGNTVVIGE
jgi:hypothetical protein